MGMETLEKHRVSRSREEAREIVTGLIGAARREIKVFAPLLDPYYFNTPTVEQGLIAFALAHTHNRAQFLIEHVPALLQTQPRLLGLLRRLGGRLEIRRVDDDDAGLREFFVVADTRAYYQQNDYEILDSSAEADAPGQAALLARRFAELWARSERITDLQPTGL